MPLNALFIFALPNPSGNKSRRLHTRKTAVNMICTYRDYSSQHLIRNMKLPKVAEPDQIPVETVIERHPVLDSVNNDRQRHERAHIGF